MRQQSSANGKNSLLPKTNTTSGGFWNAVDDSSLCNPNTLRAVRFQRNLLLGICALLGSWVVFARSDTSSSSLSLASAVVGGGSSSCVIQQGEYLGPVYHSIESGTIGEPKCLLNSKWIRVSLHTVKFPGSEAVYDDWMWIDYHDRINVLVEDERTNPKEEPRFLVFEQTKYALEGRTSKAIIGGIIEVGEDAETAARREVEEEMKGLFCEEFHFLGRHRTDVNRGMGWLNGFLATKCRRDSSKKDDHHANVNEIGVADTEKQKLQSISLTELKEALIHEQFLEVQWTATVAQAIVQFYS